MLPAELAVLLKLDPIGIVPLVLLGAVIPLLALSALESDAFTHSFTPPGMRRMLLVPVPDERPGHASIRARHF